MAQKLKRRLTKPPLAYLELHLTDHCNMNCCGCGHFSNVASAWYADPESHNRDMRRLSQLFSNISSIHLLGGEPLQHPKVTEFLSSTRRWFPQAIIRLVTNGILLPSMGQDFWQCCRANRISISITLYPPMLNKEDALRRLVSGENLELVINKTSIFVATLNPKGDSDPRKAMQACRKRYYTPFLKEGQLYLCPFSALAPIYNQVFRAEVPAHSGAVDIHTRSLTGWDVLELLERPADVCRFCSYEVRKYAWKRTTKTKEEYDFNLGSAKEDR
jgi:hypothetical protein